jgi:hypothetical protein
MITIKDFCEKHEIERRVEKYGDYSDLYVDICKRYKSEVEVWFEMGADGNDCKHMLRYYKEGDLKEYFKEFYGFTEEIPEGMLSVSDSEEVE